jgi:hypothetical protein
MNRRPTTQDITWLLDLARNQQLDLSPAYQRKSIWTPKDRQFFLDTIFRDYPSPAIFLHKTVSGEGKSMYHVVDGKQRLETILAFVNNKIRISKTFGDTRLDGKKWQALDSEPSLKHQFWNYQVSVEMVDTIDGSVVNEVFDRLNRNSRRLTSQELRHAKYDGWLISTVEAEAEKEEWKKLGVVTTARAKRMADTQFISELLLVILGGKITGFDQDGLDQAYADYDDPQETVFDFSEEETISSLENVKAFLLEMETTNHAVSGYAKNFNHFYTLWCVIALNPTLAKDSAAVAGRYEAFMQSVESVANSGYQAILDAAGEGIPAGTRGDILYYEYSRGASTDFKPRQERYNALLQAIL